MKILVLNYEFPPVGGGGGQASADLCAELTARGHTIRLLTTHAPGLPKREERDGYLVLRAFTGRRSLFKASFLVMASYIIGAFLPGVWQLLTWKPEIIHVHFAVPTGALAYILSRIGRIPYVLTAHLGDVPGGVREKTDRWFGAILPFTFRIWNGAEAVVAVSEYTKTLALQYYDVPIRVIPNGIRPRDHHPPPNHNGKTPRLVFAGRFQPQKNLGLLIDILARVRDLDWQCALIGDGPTRPEVEQKITACNLGDRVSLTGWLEVEEVAEWLDRSDVLIMPSTSEGLPVVGVQALSQGLAIVATQAGGLAEIVQDGVNGRSCAVGDLECLESGLRWCLEDSDRLIELKRASLKLAHRYDIRRIAAEYEALLMEVVGSAVPS